MINRYYFYNITTSEGHEVSGITTHRSWFKNPWLAMDKLNKILRSNNIHLVFNYRQFHEIK